MRAGLLRHRIGIEKRVETVRDDFGEVIASWETVFSRWAQISPLRGKELLDADKVEGRVTHRIVTRWIADLTPDMRIVFGTRAFGIVSALLVDERKIMMEILVQEITGTTVVAEVFDCFSFMDGDGFCFMDGGDFCFMGGPERFDFLFLNNAESITFLDGSNFEFLEV